MLPLVARRARVARSLESDAASASAVDDDGALERSIARNRRRGRSRRLDAAIRPTFFELIAAERLAPSLKGALAYALGTLANAGAPGLAHYALDRGDEVFAALTFLAELKSFASGDGSLAESVYGLQRAPRTVTDARVRRDGRYRIDAWQRIASAALLALGPYARSKAAALHETLAPERYLDARRRARRVFDSNADDMGVSEDAEANAAAVVAARNAETGRAGRREAGVRRGVSGGERVDGGGDVRDLDGVLARKMERKRSNVDVRRLLRRTGVAFGAGGQRARTRGESTATTRRRARVEERRDARVERRRTQDEELRHGLRTISAHRGRDRV